MSLNFPDLSRTAYSFVPVLLRCVVRRALAMNGASPCLWPHCRGTSS
jgi:hypothetical protein